MKVLLLDSGIRGSGPGYRPPFGDLSGLRPPGADYLSRLMTPPGLSGHEALQRQLMFERERGLLAGSNLLPASLASQHLQQRQHEGYLRYTLVLAYRN